MKSFMTKLMIILLVNFVHCEVTKDKACSNDDSCLADKKFAYCNPETEKCKCIYGLMSIGGEKECQILPEITTNVKCGELYPFQCSEIDSNSGCNTRKENCTCDSGFEIRSRMCIKIGFPINEANCKSDFDCVIMDLHSKCNMDKKKCQCIDGSDDDICSAPEGFCVKNEDCMDSEECIARRCVVQKSSSKQLTFSISLIITGFVSSIIYN